MYSRETLTWPGFFHENDLEVKLRLEKPLKKEKNLTFRTLYLQRLVKQENTGRLCQKTSFIKKGVGGGI